MKKKYLHEGAFWFFEEGQQPAGAVEVAEDNHEEVAPVQQESVEQTEDESEDKSEDESEDKSEGESEDKAMKAELQTKAVKPKNKAMETKKK